MNSVILNRKLEENPDKCYIVDDSREDILTSFKTADIVGAHLETLDEPVKVNFETTAIERSSERVGYITGVSQTYTSDDAMYGVIETSTPYDFRILIPKDSPFCDDKDGAKAFDNFMVEIEKLRVGPHTRGTLIKTPYLSIISKPKFKQG